MPSSTTLLALLLCELDSLPQTQYVNLDTVRSLVYRLAADPGTMLIYWAATEQRQGLLKKNGATIFELSSKQYELDLFTS